MDLQFISSIHQVSREDWNTLWQQHYTTSKPQAYPFCRWEFLAALEDSGSTTAETGWQPWHALVLNQGKVVAAMPLYIKSHSYGEYVFDWGWADAYHRHGLDYYPKLVAAIPFTPATGPRWAAQSTIAEQALWRGLENLLSEGQYSSLHLLFPQQPPALTANKARQANLPLTLLSNGSLALERLGCQFHWFNQNYSSFDDFLQGFTSRKRKDLKKERRKVEQQDLTVRMREGVELSPDDWLNFHQLYVRTYLKRSGHQGYLTQAFFTRLGKDLGQQVVMAQAYLGNKLVAAALYFKDDECLYGRYWGAVEEFDGLHFECCYYQGIEYAIAQGLQRFDPGAQGEHKIQRGFTPILTQSFHWIEQPEFARAIADFITQEQQGIKTYCQECRTSLPFKEDFQPVQEDILIRGSKERLEIPD